jgi:hypothetical protein
MSSGGSINKGYAYKLAQVRDASDWIKFKKQIILQNDPKFLRSADPWFIAGNNARLDWLNGRYKSSLCIAACSGGAFIGGFVGPNPGP